MEAFIEVVKETWRKTWKEVIGRIGAGFGEKARMDGCTSSLAGKCARCHDNHDAQVPSIN